MYSMLSKNQFYFSAKTISHVHMLILDRSFLMEN
jgi:hypothetical protein